MEGHWWGEGDKEWRNIGGVRDQNGGTLDGVREHRMEGQWWCEGDTEWRDIGGVREHRMEGHWWGEGKQNGETLVG